MTSVEKKTGFPARDNTDLGMAILIVESEDGEYEPVSVIGSLSEASEMARLDMQRRIREAEAGETPMWPAIYKVWTRRANGDYSVACTIDALSLTA
jgi:hypothetical protein